MANFYDLVLDFSALMLKRLITFSCSATEAVA
jgi:hypothetical protein